MLRNLSYVLFVTTAAVLLAATVGLLAKEVSDGLSGGRAIRLVAFDAVMPEGASKARVVFALQDADHDTPLLSPYLFAMFPDGRTELAWTSAKGLGASDHAGRFSPGATSYEVHFGDTDLRMEVCARGTVWVEPPGAAAVWVDAGALVREAPAADVAGATRFATAREAAEVLKGLAESRRIVYLVARLPRDYAAVRHQLVAAGYPSGPALWIPPGQEASVLQSVRHTWRQVAAALVCTPALAQATKQLKIRTLGVPPAQAAPGEEAGPPHAWYEAAEALASK